MSLSDEQLELLDRYLDGDLSDAEAVGLEARLSNEASLADELARLREHRAARASAFAALEPGDLETRQLQWYVRGAIRQQQQQHAAVAPSGGGGGAWLERGRWMVAGLSKLAAVLAIGFAVGYAYRAPGPTVVAPTGNGNGGILAAGDAGLGHGLRPTPAGIAPAGDGIVTPVAQVISPEPAAVGGFEVALRDQFGNVVARQRFRTLQEARDFAGDLDRWQQRYRQVQKNGVRFIGDDF